MTNWSYGFVIDTDSNEDVITTMGKEHYRVIKISDIYYKIIDEIVTNKEKW
jgi:hypothetical protein